VIGDWRKRSPADSAVLLGSVDHAGKGFHPIGPGSRRGRRPPRCLHHFVSYSAKKKGIGLSYGLSRVTKQVFVRGDRTMIGAAVQGDVDGIAKGSHCVRKSTAEAVDRKVSPLPPHPLIALGSISPRALVSKEPLDAGDHPQFVFLCLALPNDASFPA